MTEVALIAFFGAATFYLGTAALIARWLWSRYPRPVARFMACAACTGTWVGLGVAAWLVQKQGRDILDLYGRQAILAGGAIGMVVTPIASAIMLYALNLLTTPPDGPTS